jgi:dimethylamine monooxygenase subunit A
MTTVDESADRAVAAFLARPVDHLANIPWPFPDDLTAFRYSVNVDQARVPRPTLAGEWGRHLVDLGGAEYPQLMAERRRILDADPGRVQLRPGAELACWDLLLYYLRDLSATTPRRCRAGRWNSSPARCPTTFSSSLSATAGSTSTPAR